MSKISELPQASTLTGTETLPIVQTGKTCKILFSTLRGATSVTDEGAVADGITDASSAIQRALNNGGNITFPGGTYKVSTALTIPSNTHVMLSSDTVLDFSSAGSSSFFTSVGTAETSMATTSNVTQFSRLIQVASTASLAVGDMIRLSSDTVFDSLRTSSKIAEIVFVESLTATDITTTEPIQDAYTTVANAKIEKITPVTNVHISGGKIVGAIAQSNVDYGADFKYCRNVSIEGTWFYRIDAAMIRIMNSVDVWVRGCRFELANADLAYGVSFIDATRDSGCVDSTFLQVRHSLSTNNSAGAASGIPRRILFENNIIYDSALTVGLLGSNTIDTHAAAEDIIISGNSVFASSSIGIGVECPSATVIGNQIVNTISDGIAIVNWSDRTANYTVTGNTIKRAGDRGIRVQSASASAGAIVSSLLSSNSIQDWVSYGITTGLSAAPSASGLVINNNTIQNCAGSLASMYVVKSTIASIAGNSITCVGTAQSGIRVELTTYSSITGNSIKLATSSSAQGFNVIAASANDCLAIAISGNTVYSQTPSGSRGITLGAGARQISIGANTLQSCTTPISVTTSTIATGIITLVGNTTMVYVDTEAAAATDDLDTISGGLEGQVTTFRAINAARDVVFKDATGNMRLAGDFTLTHTDDTITLLYSGAVWLEVCRSDNTV